MTLETLPQGQQRGNFSQLAELQTALFRLEAHATLTASPEGLAALGQLDQEHRTALANQFADSVAHARKLADTLTD